MIEVARFEKISEQQFELDCIQADFDATGGAFSDAYANIRMPVRATSGSAGYDFFLPFPLTLLPGSARTIPTGVRVAIQKGWVLMLCPKSGLGFRYRLQLDNTVGIIDADYYGAANEGHILVRITNDSKTEQSLNLEAGKAFVQGIFIQFGIAQNDETQEKRHGGFGSTEV